MKNQLKEFFRSALAKILLIFLCFSIVYSTGAALLFGVSLKDAASNVLLQVFITFLPGLGLYTLLFPDKKSWPNVIFISYALGYSINILEYFITKPLGSNLLVIIFSYVVSLLAVYALIKKPLACKELAMKKVFGNKMAVLFLLFVLLQVYLYVLPNAAPELVGSTLIDKDNQYWMNNSVSLLIKFPAENVFLAGLPLFYHYFSSVHIAFSSILSGINIYNLTITLYPVTRSLIMIGGVSYMLDTLGAKKKQKLFLMVVLFFSTGFELLVRVSDISHFITNPFGMGIGIGLAAFFISIFIEALKKSDEKFNWRLFIAAILFYAILVGVKSPVATIISIIPAVVCIVWLFQKKFKYAFIYGITIVLIFLIISIFCCGLLDVFGDTDSVYDIRVRTMIEMGRVWLTPNMYINAAVSSLLFFVLAQPILAILFVAAFVKYIADIVRKKIDSTEIIIRTAFIATALVGILFWLVFMLIGGSEMYFIMSAYLPIAALSIAVTKFTYKKSSNIFRWLAGVFFAVLLMVQVLLALNTTYYVNKTVYVANKNIVKIVEGNNAEPMPENIASGTLQKSDAEALYWIRDNTPIDSMIASDRATYEAQENGSNRYFYFAAFAQRQMYVEGTSVLNLNKGTGHQVRARQYLIKDFFSNVDGAYDKLIEAGVDYIVQTKWLTPDFVPYDGLELVYSTKTINVYKVKH